MTNDRCAGRASSDCDRILLARGARSTVIRLPRHGVAAVLTIVAAAFVWSAAAGFYVFFHDEIVSGLRREAEVAATVYETRIADLRTDLERARTRALVESTGATERFTELARRQEALERRQSVLAALAAPALTQSPAGADRALSFGAKPTPLDRPTPAFDALDVAPFRNGSLAPADKLSFALDRLDASQSRALDHVAERVGERRRKLERIYDQIGLSGRDAPDGRGRGGPFEPLPAHARSFEARAERLSAEQVSVVTLRRGLDAVPLRTPAPGAAVSSGFGTRLDPFLRQPAFHAGIDFESAYGQPIRATAAGRVVTAGVSGGYGQMVEIDHGRGLTTRFGHMSSINVQPGDQVAAGTVIGRVGSTGRSTGPHLHYETRIDGEAVDPIRFLRAGRSLAAVD